MFPLKMTTKENEILEQLVALKNQFRNNTNKNILLKHGISEQINEFQKPVVDSLKKIEEKTLPPITFSGAEENKSIRDHSRFIHVYSQGENHFLKLKERDSPQLIFNPKSNQLKIFPNDGSQEQNKIISEGVKEIIFNDQPDTNKISDEDFSDAFEIYHILGEKPGYSKRLQNLVSTRDNKEELEFYIKSFNKNVKQIKQVKKIGKGFGLGETFRFNR